MCSVDSRESLPSYFHIYVKDKDSARICNLFQTVIKKYIWFFNSPDNFTYFGVEIYQQENKKLNPLSRIYHFHETCGLHIKGCHIKAYSFYKVEKDDTKKGITV